MSSVTMSGGMMDGYVEVNGARIHVVVQGQGQPVLLVHGYPLSGELFAKNRAALSRHYRVITLDLRGFGKSTAPQGDAGSLQTYAKDALGVLDALKIQKAVIGGMSMGGPVVFEMYREAPERFSGMMLIDTIANPASIVEQHLWKGMAQKAVTFGSQSLVGELLKDMLTGQTRMNMPQQAAFLGGIVKQATVAADVAGAVVLANRPDSVPTLGTITVPTLIIVGLEDTVYPPVFSMKMQQNIKGSKLVIIPGAAHAATYEKANAVNAAMLSFLNGMR
ncbi:MAG: alpha/beta fold hydrolase [Deinococcus sp.]